MAILWFKSLNIWSQKIIKIPIFGDITVRQAILMGFGAFIDYVVFIKHEALGPIISMMIASPTILLYIFAIWPVKSYPIEYVILRTFFKPSIKPKVEEEQLVEVGEMKIDVVNIDRARPVFIRRVVGRRYAGRGYEVRIGGVVVSSGTVSDKGQAGFWFIPSRMGTNNVEIYVDGVSEPVDRITINVSQRGVGEI